MSFESKIANFKKCLNVNEIWFCEYKQIPRNTVEEYKGNKGEYHFIMIIDKMEEYCSQLIKIKHLNSGKIETRDYTFLSNFGYRKLKPHNHPKKKKDE
jgi:hypothetical protein